MPTKRITCNFFNFSEPDGYKGKIDALFENQNALRKIDKVDNVLVAGNIVRITSLNKVHKGKDYWWVGIVERLDTTEQAEIANLDGKKTVYGTAADEGPIVNTGFVYYPLTNTVALHRKQGGINDIKFGVFIRKLLVQTKTVNKNSRKFTMDVLPDLNKLDRLYKSPNIKQLEYSFALPENLSSQGSNKRTIFGDFYMAKHLGGQRMKVTITSDDMNVMQTVNKVKRMIKSVGKEKMGSLKATTIHNNIEEPLDLLSNKFSDFIDVKLQKGKKETVIVIMDTINKIFEKQLTLIQTMYINDSEEE